MDGDFTLLLPDHPIFTRLLVALQKWNFLYLKLLAGLSPFRFPYRNGRLSHADQQLSGVNRHNSGSPKLQLRPWETRVYKRILT